jgi:hypothetical protein
LKKKPPSPTQEFHDLPLVWEPGSSVPDWLSGTYVRNGPAQISFGSERLELLYTILKFDFFSALKLLKTGRSCRVPNFKNHNFY